MNTGLNEYILAIVTCEKDRVISGGCPVFLASGQEEMEHISLLLARILGGIVHDLENGIYFICKH
jgi:hypothetical protein